jgi:pimeloyl-ACP methyl ester carboxylesterase
MYYRTMVPSRYAYLHGFASSPLSKKGRALRRAFADRGIPFELPDLNQPSFASLSHDACLGAIDAMDCAAKREGERWRFVGSSFGGWLAARWAELHPERVERLVLLCPGFELEKRWPVILGDAKMAEWGRKGELPFADATGALVPVHYGFFVESLRQPGRPVVPCEALILHGVRDDVVPIESSRRYVAEHPGVRLVELGDDHELMASLDRVIAETLRFLGVG